jgi:hypothetical protein
MSELKERLLSGDRRVASALIKVALEEKDPEGFILGHLANLENNAAVSSLWDALVARLDSWPHDTEFAPTVAVEVAIAAIPPHQRSLPAHWRERLLRGEPCSWFNVAASLNLYPESVDLLKDWSRALEKVTRYQPSQITFYSKTWRSADYSFLLDLLRAPLCRELKSCGIELPVKDKTLLELLEVLATKKVSSLSLSGLPAQLGVLLSSPVQSAFTSLQLCIGKIKNEQRVGLTNEELASLAAAPLAKSLVSLDLSNNNLNDDSLAVLSKGQFPALRSLNLSYNHFGGRGLTELVKASWWSSIKELSLDWITQNHDTNTIRLSNAGIQPVLENAQKIELLSLVGNGLTDESAAMIAKHCTSLQDLNLRLNRLSGNESIRALLTMPSLVQIDLDNCLYHTGIKFLASIPELGPSLLRIRLSLKSEELEGAFALASAPWKDKVEIETNGLCQQLLFPGEGETTIEASLGTSDASILSVLPNYSILSEVKHIKLRWHQGDPAPESFQTFATSPAAASLRSLRLSFRYGLGAENLFHALADGTLKSLEILSVGPVHLEPAAVQALLQSDKLPALRSLLLLRAGATSPAAMTPGALSMFIEPKGRRLDGLAIEDNVLSGGEPWLQQVTKIIEARSLKRLYVSGRFSPEETNKFFKSQKLSPLYHLGFSGGSLTQSLWLSQKSLELHKCQLSIDTIQSLAGLNLEHLFLSGVSLKPEEMQVLASLPLRSLSLSHMYLTEKHMEALLSLRSMKTLQYLDLSGNKLTPESVMMLMTAPCFPALRFLDVFDAKLEDALAEPLLKLMPQLSTLVVSAASLVGALQKTLRRMRPALQIQCPAKLSEERIKERALARLCPDEPDGSLPRL